MFWNKVVGWKCFIDCLKSIIKKTGLATCEVLSAESLQPCDSCHVTLCHAVHWPKRYRFLAHWTPKDEGTMRNHSPQQTQSHSRRPDFSNTLSFTLVTFIPAESLQLQLDIKMAQVICLALLHRTCYRHCQHFKFLVCLSVIMAVWLAGWLAMERGHLWEADNSSNSQEIPHISWNLQVHYHVHNSPPPVPVLSHTNRAHILWSCFFKTYFNIIFPSRHGLPCGHYPSSFLT